MKIWVPVIIFLLLGILLASSLFNNKQHIAPQLNKPAPILHLSSLEQPQEIYKPEIFLGKISLVNFWATWCAPCLQEHVILMDIAEKYPVSIIGINYKDNSLEAKQWLRDKGNPYTLILEDNTGQAGIDWGVIAVPETFVVDAQGIVRYKHTGVITRQQWEDEIWPFINSLS